MFEGLASTELLIVVALATLLVPFAFLGLLALAFTRRGASKPVGPRLENAVAVAGGLSIGTLLLIGSDPVLAAPLVLAGVVVIVGRWRARRRVQAGWLAAGIGTPLALAWGTIVAAPAVQVPGNDGIGPLAWALAGLGLAIGGLVVVVRGDPPPAPPDPAAPAGQPGSRSYGSIAEAIRAPSRVGPFALPEIALLVAMVATSLVVPFFLPRDLPDLVRVVIVGMIVALVGTEAFVRAWPSVSRRAFEAFSWLGEWELAGARQITGGGVPRSKLAAAAWLAGHPERPEELAFRIEMLLFAGRIDEARELLPQLPAATPWERFSAASLADLTDWQAGGEGDLPAMEAAAAAILPADGDERLRAEVSIATAKVRRLMAAARSTPAEVVEPLLEVRERLGRRADGQVGRALRRRILPLVLIFSVVLVGIGEVLRLAGIPLV